jgi:predicted transcriptional regulator
MLTRSKARTVYVTWVRSLAIAAAALGLAGAVLTGATLEDDPQPASAAVTTIEAIDSAEK